MRMNARIFKSTACTSSTSMTVVNLIAYCQIFNELKLLAILKHSTYHNCIAHTHRTKQNRVLPENILLGMSNFWRPWDVADAEVCPNTPDTGRGTSYM